MTIIETKDLTKFYGKNRGIIDVNLRVDEGEIFGFIGPNGAGKSTLIRTLLNFIYPSSGEGRIFNKDIKSQSSSIKKRVGYVPSEVKYYANVYVGDIIDYAKTFKRIYKQEDVKDLIKDLELDTRKKMKELSLGNKKKLAIVQALIGEPSLLILDEPTSGLDPLMQKKLFNILRQRQAKGTTIFLSSHNLREVEDLCDRVAIIRKGEIIDTLDLESTLRDFGRIIEVEADLPKDFIEEMAYELLTVKDNKYKFIYRGSIDKFIKAISPYHIDNLTIRKENLEDNFIKYYEEEI